MYLKIDLTLGVQNRDFIYIDYAIFFIGDEYPTINALMEKVKTKNNKYCCEVKHDIITLIQI
jgi:hypothetical protein